MIAGCFIALHGMSGNFTKSIWQCQTKYYEKKRYFLPSVSKDRVMYQGNDSREFWVRAEDRNKHRLYDELGTWYEAIEAFAI
jgi:hypothetical protein